MSKNEYSKNGYCQQVADEMRGGSDPFGGIRAVGYAQARRFTRNKEALDRAIRVFESMEGTR